MSRVRAAGVGADGGLLRAMGPELVLVLPLPALDEKARRLVLGVVARPADPPVPGRPLTSHDVVINAISAVTT